MQPKQRHLNELMALLPQAFMPQIRPMTEPPRPGFLREYEVVVWNLWQKEMTTSGDERLVLGFTARGLAGFIRRQLWTNEADRKAGFKLAARADKLAVRLLKTITPIGQA